MFRCFPCVKGNPIKFYGAFWLLPAFVFSPVNSWRGTGGAPPPCPPRACLGARPSHLRGAAGPRSMQIHPHTWRRVGFGGGRCTHPTPPWVESTWGGTYRPAAKGVLGFFLDFFFFFSAPRLRHMAVGMEKSIWTQVLAPGMDGHPMEGVFPPRGQSPCVPH